MGKILVADDNELCRELMKGIIKEQGHEAIEARNGQEALNIVQNQKIDLIFMDCVMPVMSGLEAAKKIKESYAIKIVGVSSNGPSFERECIKAGMDYYTSKPVDFKIIRAHLAEV